MIFQTLIIWSYRIQSLRSATSDQIRIQSLWQRLNFWIVTEYPKNGQESCFKNPYYAFFCFCIYIFVRKNKVQISKVFLSSMIWNEKEFNQKLLYLLKAFNILKTKPWRRRTRQKENDISLCDIYWLLNLLPSLEFLE